MSKELFIDVQDNDIRIALSNDRELIELHNEKLNKSYLVGDIYLGRVKKIMPGLNATFVDVQYDRDAFLHYLDLGPNINSLISFFKKVRNNQKIDPLLKDFKLEPEILKSGKITEVVGKLPLLPVQIVKEPIANKGPRLSSEISFAGRYLVLVPFAEGVSISKKIKSNQEKIRLKRLVEKLKPKNFSVIIRTVSEGKGFDELNADLNELIEKWKRFVHQLKDTIPGEKIFGENDRTTTLLRDILNESFSNIHINSEKLYKETKEYVAKIAPDKEKIVKLYKGKATLFEHFGVEKQIKGLFGKTVNLFGGAYLIIEHTEALHVIDVNSGNRSLGDKNQEEQALQVNKEAAKEIARQLSLRDMGGIIVIDFIDMQKHSAKKELYRTLIEEMQKDRAKHNILPPSKFGLVQITRQRVRPEMTVKQTETCPTCNGSGEVRPTVLIEDDIEKNIAYLFNEQGEKQISISFHPYLAAYFKKGLISKRLKWFFKYYKWIHIIEDTSNQLTEFHFLRGKEQENIAM